TRAEYGDSPRRDGGKLSRLQADDTATHGSAGRRREDRDAGHVGLVLLDLFPRDSAAQQRALGIIDFGPGTAEERRRAVLAKLARRRKNSAGLVAYRGGEPIGFISLGPRHDFSRVENSRATPPVDDVAAWVIPCITVRRGHRGQGVAVAMIRAAVDYAGRRGAPAVEAYPRADGK